MVLRKDLSWWQKTSDIQLRGSGNGRRVLRNFCTKSSAGTNRIPTTHDPWELMRIETTVLLPTDS